MGRLVVEETMNLNYLLVLCKSPGDKALKFSSTVLASRQRIDSDGHYYTMFLEHHLCYAPGQPMDLESVHGVIDVDIIPTMLVRIISLDLFMIDILLN